MVVNAAILLRNTWVEPWPASRFVGAKIGLSRKLLGMEPTDMHALDRDIKAIGERFRPLEVLLRPMFLGLEHIPKSRPLLFVGNHTIYGVLDVPFLYLGLNRELDICLRPLGDHIHFKIPGWREFITRYGVVEGSREACAQLLRDDQCVLVFPGGAREVAKRRGEKYQLQWGKRLGFVRMALEAGCTIVPFAALGADDAYDILLDANDIMGSPLGKVLSRLGARKDALLPVSRGFGMTGLPRPERLYFEFCKPIDLSPYQGRQGDDELCLSIRGQVADSIEEAIASLKSTRQSDPKRGLKARLKDAIGLL